MARTSVAERLVDLVEMAIGSALPVRLRAWDRSEAGPSGGPVLVLENRRALRRLIWSPGELGLARAYVAGDLSVEGDLFHALQALADLGRAVGRRPHLSAGTRARLVREAALLGAIGPAPKPPAEEVRLAGDRHSLARDRSAISHHYDVGNDFYEKILGPSWVYSCAYWAADAEGYGLADAQRDKLDLICRKLGLQPGMRVLDVGCGWGSFALHAAEHYGVDVVGITLSTEQQELGRKRAVQADLADRVEFRLQDWRELSDGPFDAIASIGMAEHVGRQRFGEYAATLYQLLRPGGRLLNHQISREPGVEPKHRTFIDSYVFPDGALLPLATVVEQLELAGLEVRDVQNLREHYTRTLLAWVANLEQNWDECVALTSPGRARVWQLYMAASALGFQRGWIRVNQTLAVRNRADGENTIPRVRETWLTAQH